MFHKSKFQKNFSKQPSYLEGIIGDGSELSSSLNFAFGVTAKDGDDGVGGGSDSSGDKGGDEKPGDDSDDKDNKGGGDKGGDKSLDPELRETLRDLMKWKQKAREAEQLLADKDKSASEAQESLTSIQKVLGDKSLDDVKELLAAEKAAQTAELEQKGQYDEIIKNLKTEHESVIAQMGESYKTETASLAEKIEALTQSDSTKTGQLDELTIGRAFSESVFIREDSVVPPSLARREFGEFFDLVDNKVVGFDKPRGSDGRAPLVNSSGDSRSFEDAIKHLYSSHSDSEQLIRSKAKPGAGSDSNSDLQAKSGDEGKPAAKGVSRIQNALNKE